MIGLLQRVNEASVNVDDQIIGRIRQGILVFVAVEKDDTETQVDRLSERLLSYRVFADAQGRMNLSVQDRKGGILLVPQFTLAADTRKGTRPSFTPAAPPEQGRRLFEHLVARIRTQHQPMASGQFGANMQVSLTNDGPVTFWIQA